MTNRELLELAAKAAGYTVDYNKVSGRFSIQHIPGIVRDVWRRWDPIGDDGDALRLSLKLKIKIEYVTEMDSVVCSLPGSMGATSVAAIGDIELRYAIVQAAAQAGLAAA